MKVIIDNVEFAAELANDATGKAFEALLPIELEMADLNNNEKYYYTSARIPRKEYDPEMLESGDIMLWQGDCIVLFYKTFRNILQYSRIGKLLNPEGLTELLSNRPSVRVRFEK